MDKCLGHNVVASNVQSNLVKGLIADLLPIAAVNGPRLVHVRLNH